LDSPKLHSVSVYMHTLTTHKLICVYIYIILHINNVHMYVTILYIRL
jgi:hypothetical protein